MVWEKRIVDITSFETMAVDRDGFAYDANSWWAGFEVSGGAAKLCNGSVINIGQWYHLVYTWDGTNQRLYTNGVLNNTCDYSYSNNLFIYVEKKVITFGNNCTEVVNIYLCPKCGILVADIKDIL